MSRLSRVLLAGLACLASSCAQHPATRIVHLQPTPGEGMALFGDAVAALPNAEPDTLDLPVLNRSVVIGGDSLLASFTFYELKDILVGEVYVYNGKRAGVPMDVEIFSLVDAQKTQLRRLEPHEAANIILSQTSGMAPELPPKYNYYAQTYGSSRSSTTSVTAVRDPYTEMGNSFVQLANALIAEQNQQLTALANTLYEMGMVGVTQIGADAAMRGAVFWRRPGALLFPLEFRIAETEYRVSLSETR